MSPLNTLPADAFKLLWLWIYKAGGASSTLAELQTLARASRHIVKNALITLSAEGLARYNGLADHSVASLALDAYSLFVVDVQPTDQPAPIPQPTVARPCAGQPTVHDQPTDPEPPYLTETLQNSLQKNFFSPEKIFSPTDEEELSINILINSSSSSQNDGPEKIFPTPVPDPLPADFDQRMTALENLAKLNSLRIRRELAELPWATPDYIERHACGFYHGEHRTVAEAGMLRRRIADHWPEPDLCHTCYYRHHPVEPLPAEDPEPTPEPAAQTQPDILGWHGTGLNPFQAWQIAVVQLQMEIPKGTFESWLRQAQFARYDHGHITITAPTPEHAAWLTDRLTTTLTRIIEGCLNQPIEITFTAGKCHE